MSADAQPLNILTPLPDASGGEVFTALLTRPGIRIERIVSQGQQTPIDAPYMQSHDEWVLLLAGATRLWLEGKAKSLWHPAMPCSSARMSRIA